MLSQQTACLVIHDKPGRCMANERSLTACISGVDVVHFSNLFFFFVACVVFEYSGLI